MEAFVSKDELLRRLNQEYMRFNNVLAQMSDAQLVEPNTIGAWSVKDLLAHFVAHEQRALEELRYALRGERLVIDHSAGDVFNAQAVSASLSQSLAEVQAAWDASFQQIVTAVAALTDADFDPEGVVVRALDDTIDGALGNNTYGHYAEHLSAVEAYLKKLSFVR